MGLLIRIQKKFENKWLHKHGVHGEPVYYAHPDDEVDQTETRRSTSGTGNSSRPGSRLANLSFLSSRRNSSPRQSIDAPSRSSSFFCRGSSQQPHARRSLPAGQSSHVRHASNLSTSEQQRRRRSGSGVRGGQTAHDAGQDEFAAAFRVPAFSDSGYVSRDSDPDIGISPQDQEALRSPSQMGNSMTLGDLDGGMRRGHRPQTDGMPLYATGHSNAGPSDVAPERSGSPELRARASSFTLGNVLGQSGRAAAVAPVLSPGAAADQYEAPTALSHSQVDDQDRSIQTACLRGFEGDREEFFSGVAEADPRPKQPERAQTTSAAAAPSALRRSNAESSVHSYMTVRADEARRARRPFTTTRALTGH